jgi:hypothetical protein
LEDGLGFTHVRVPHFQRGASMKATIAATALTFVALTASSATAQDIAGTGSICLNTPGGPFALCTFQTMAQCEQAKLPTTISRCVDRSQLEGTVGSGAHSPPSRSASPPTDGAGQR